MRLCVCVSLCTHAELRVYFQLCHSAFKASSQMLLIWRSIWQKKKKTQRYISVCLLHLVFLLAQCFGLSYPKVNHFVSPKHLFPLHPSHHTQFTYSTLILDPSLCVGYSDILTQGFKMSFKTHSLLLGLFYFPSVRLQGQFAPTADERSIADLNLKSRGLGGGQLTVYGVAMGGLSPEAHQRHISFHRPSTPTFHRTSTSLVNSQDHD